MDSFEALGIGPELVEALAADGIEQPTPLQETAIPVLRRANNALLAAGPGSGTLIAWGAAILDALDGETEGPACLVLTPTAQTAEALARSLAPLATAAGHSVAALESPWVMPERARVLFATPAAALAAARGGSIPIGSIESLIVDQAEKLETLGLFPVVESVLGFLPKEGQRVVTALPVTKGVSDFVERHARRATMIPSAAPEAGSAAASLKRGAIRFRVVAENREDGVLATVAELLDDDVRHVLVFSRSEDRAADLGDHLAMHGYDSSSPGDETAPVWLGVDALEARAAVSGVTGLAVVSADVPVGPDELDRRHGIADDGVAVIVPREIPHLRDLARRTGYSVQPLPMKPAARPEGLRDLRDQLARAIEQEDVDAYALVLEPLFEQYDAVQVAAAATALLRKKVPDAPVAAATPADAAVRSAPAWVRVFLSVGERDGLTPGDLLGAITGEAGVPGGKVGKIEIKESHSLADVEESVARQVITALNGTSIRGRAVRADVDRPRRSGPGRGSGAGGGGGSRGRPPRPT